VIDVVAMVFLIATIVIVPIFRDRRDPRCFFWCVIQLGSIRSGSVRCGSVDESSAVMDDRSLTKPLFGDHLGRERLVMSRRFKP